MSAESEFSFAHLNDKAEFSKRLRAAMLAAGYADRPAVLEREFNARYWGRAVTFQAVSRWLRGQSIPSQEKLLVLAEWLRLEPQTLRYGEQAVERIRESQERWEDARHYQERATFEAFLDLPPAERKIVREVILAFAKSTAGSEKAN